MTDATANEEHATRDIEWMKGTHKVVCVDDEPAILAALRRLLRREPYTLMLTDKPGEALEWIGKQDVSVIVADQRMPDMSGTELLTLVRERSPGTIRVMLTGYADMGAISDAVNEGAIRRLINKPWNDDDLKRTLRELIVERELDKRSRLEEPIEKSGRLQSELEEALRKQMSVLQLSQELIEGLELPLAGVGADFKIADCNKAFGRLFENGPGLTGRDARDVLPKEVCDRLAALLKKPGEETIRGVAFPAGRATVRIRSLVAGEAVIGAMIRAIQEVPRTPITTRRTREIRIKMTGPQPAGNPLPEGAILNARMFDSILSASLDPVVVFDRDGRLLYANAATAGLFGLDRADLVDKTWRELGFPRDTVERLEAQRQGVMKSGRSLTSEFGYATVRGAREFEYILSAVEADGKIDAVVCTIRDITDRKRVEKELRERNLVLENAVEAISRVNRDGRFVEANPSFARLLSAGPEELAGMEGRAIVHQDDRARVEAAYQEMLSRDKAEVEARGLRKDGTVFPMSMLMIKAFDKEGNFDGHYLFIKDITERKRSEEERGRMTAELLQAQKLQAVGQLTAGIAHEINNPVGYLLSNLSALGDYFRDLARLVQAARPLLGEADPAKVRENLKTLHEEIDADYLLQDYKKALQDSLEGAQRIRDIVKNLRDFSLVDEGEIRPADINEGLENAIKLCWNELKYKTTVHRDYGALPPVVCYPQRINQVFLNLLVNAAHAIETKGDIFISTSEDNGFVAIRIRDTGRGIAPEYMGKIFEPFFTTKPVGQATGLGLHVAYQIVKAHGGRIEAVSEPGKGTEFTVRLPIGGPKGQSNGGKAVQSGNVAP